MFKRQYRSPGSRLHWKVLRDSLAKGGEASRGEGKLMGSLLVEAEGAVALD